MLCIAGRQSHVVRFGEYNNKRLLHKAYKKNLLHDLQIAKNSLTC